MMHWPYSAKRFADGYQAASALGLPRPYPAGAEDLSHTDRSNSRLPSRTAKRLPPSASRSLALAFANARLGNNDVSLSAWKDFTNDYAACESANARERGIDNFYRQDFEAAAADLNSVAQAASE